MSGLCGVVNLDGAPVEERTLQRMADAAPFLASGGVFSWTEGSVGLAQLAGGATAQDGSQSGPLVLQHGQIVVVADARIDNREELIRTLTAESYLSGQPPSDAELILAAYERWGDECASMILGDFGFALWDGRTEQLLCARDPFGMRPLFYHIDGQRFVFASTARQVLAQGDVSARLDERGIAYYLTGQPYDYLTEGTYFEGVRRLRPAHTLAVARSGSVTQSRYWDIDRSHIVCYDGDAGCATELTRLLKQSVRARSRQPVAVFTSGGLDSSSIACLLGRLREEGEDPRFRLVSFTYGEGHPSDESQYVRAIAGRYQVEVDWIDGRLHLPLVEPSVGTLDDEPPRWVLDGLWRAGLDQVARSACSAAMVGIGGDALFSPNYVVLIAEMLRERRYVDCLRELRRVHPTRRGYLASAVGKHLARESLPGWARRLYRKHSTHGLPPWVGRDFTRRVVGDVPPEKWPFPGYGFRSVYSAARYHGVTDWVYPVEGACQHLGALHGVEMRDPFLDRRLVEFALALPVEQIYRDGVTKRVLRNAMAGILADEIRLRRAKTVADAVLKQGLVQWAEQHWQVPVTSWNSVQQGYVNGRQWEKALRVFRATPSTAAAQNLWRPILLEEWLESVPKILRSQARGT